MCFVWSVVGQMWCVLCGSECTDAVCFLRIRMDRMNVFDVKLSGER